MPDLAAASPLPVAQARAPRGGTAPATTPLDARGKRAQAHAAMGAILTAMSKILPDLGITSEEGQDVIKALGVLAKRFGQAAPDLTRGAMRLMMEQAPALAPPGSPQQRQQIQQRLQSMQSGGLGGGPAAPASPAPAAAPPMAGAA